MLAFKRFAGLFICLALVLGLSACASHSRSSSKPIAGETRDSIVFSKRSNPSWTLAQRKSTDDYYLFGFVNNYVGKVQRQQKYKHSYLSGADPDVCFPVVSASLGIYLPIDFLIWVVQLGGNNSACFAQIFDFSPSERWGSKYNSGETYKYSEPLKDNVRFYYNDRYISSEKLGGGVFAIAKHQLPKPMAQLKLKMESGYKVVFSDK